MSKGFAPIILLLVILLAAGGIGFAYYVRIQNSTPTNVPTTEVEMNTTLPAVPSSWKTYTSSKFNYTFKYPDTWKAYFYNEAEAISGVHTITNYDSNEIEKYMDHGIINWEKFGKSAVKTEISYYKFNFPEQFYAGDLSTETMVTVNNMTEYIEKVLKVQNANTKEVASSNITIGTLKTNQLLGDNTNDKHLSLYYALPHENEMIFVTVSAQNMKSNFESTDEVESIKQLASSFEFK
jgi:hypothetical protein